MSTLSVKNANGVWEGIEALQGEQGIRGVNGVDGTQISIRPEYNAGQKIATITCDGVVTKLYAPAIEGGGGSDVSYTPGRDFVDSTTIGTLEIEDKGTYAIKIPSKLSSFTNDSEFITADDIPEIPTVPTDVSAFTNDVNYVKKSEFASVATQNNFAKLSDIPNSISAFTNDVDYATRSELPDMRLSQYVNDMNFATRSEVNSLASSYGYAKRNEIPTKNSELQNDMGYIYVPGNRPLDLDCDVEVTGTLKATNTIDISSIAPAYDATHTYAEGDVVVYNNKVWKKVNSTQSAPSNTNWEETDLYTVAKTLSAKQEYTVGQEREIGHVTVYASGTSILLGTILLDYPIASSVTSVSVGCRSGKIIGAGIYKSADASLFTATISDDRRVVKIQYTSAAIAFTKYEMYMISKISLVFS